MLPFQASMIAEFAPIVKLIDYNSKYASQTIQEGKVAANEGQLDKAFDLYNQATNALM